MRYEQTNTFKLWWFILILIPLLAGCDLFISSLKPRDNPLDPENPTPAVSELKAFGLSTDSVKVQWATAADDNGNYPSVVIVRNSVQEPTSINDGTQVYTGPTSIADGDVYAEYTDGTAGADTNYYYGIWAYTEQDGTTSYNGPLTDTATTKLHNVEISVSWDGYLFWDTTTPYIDDTMMDLYLSWEPGVVERYIFLSFDFTNTPDFGELVEAGLRMYKSSAGGSTDWQVSAARIIQSWNTAEDLNLLHDRIVVNNFMDFSDDVNASEITIPWNITDFYTWNVKDTISAWLIDKEPNYGILVRSRTIEAGTMFNFYASEYSNDPDRPRLILKYYGDPPDEI